MREEFDWLTLPTAESQALGTVNHKLAEEVDAGDFDHVPSDELRNAVRTRWMDLIQAVYEQMESQSLFGTPAPPKRWPYYVVKQSSAIERAMVRREMRGAGQGFRRPDVEVLLDSDVLQLVGRADKVEYIGEDVRIVDLKTAENPGGSIPHAYEVQLLLYAAMWRDTTGKTPKSVAIEWQDGTRSYKDVYDADLDNVIDRLKLARNQLELANAPVGITSEDVCRFCSYRVLCPQFHVADRNVWVRQAPSIVGRVSEIVQTHNDCVLVIDAMFSQPPDLEIAVVHKFPLNQLVSVGDCVVFDRLSWRGGQGNFDVVWNTRFSNFNNSFPEIL